MTLLEIRDDILRALSAQQEKRDEYEGLAWIEAERAVMLRATNSWRAKNGLPDVDRMAVARVESWARGHVDYSSKYALYCAELALGGEVAP